MAANANSTTAPAIATLAIQANAVSETKTKTVLKLADTVAALMQEIHGGTWRAFVEHGANSEFVLIRPLNEKAISKPKRGEVA
ncbi:hypothetical protein [Mesorhizobium sp. Pch-S]|uniref:hypothetical protein n=1 Tax=Mesorhizobium sp. Pch-S TaxID=2082387 RepID=UPI00101185F2|nr:hypothetical protein [Mesorhizobium sp. Pch-S]QAZ45967.1 hypothetical protein C1M53_26655 [Mesorhizobium sp. Pch-S]